MIPVFEPDIGQLEIDAVVAALKRGEISGSFGQTIPQFEEKTAAYCGVKYGIAVSSGTTALHLAVASAGIQPGEEILVSALTNIASALCAHHQKAFPVAVDSEAITWNMDLDRLESLITPRTKAIMVVHHYGHPVDMIRLMKVAKKHSLLVIEDCAESQGATCHGKMTGGFGDIGCLSFYANKIITTGEGGMLLTNNKAIADRAKLLRNLAFTEPRFRHEVAGYNFRMTGYQAAMGIAQLSRIEEIISEKRRMARGYHRQLGAVAGLQLPVELAWARNVYWMFGVVVQPEFGITRDELVRYLKEQGIETRTFFCPMNLQPCFADQPNYTQTDCPVAERLWQDGLYLPSSPLLTEKQIQFVCEKVAGAPREVRDRSRQGAITQRLVA